MSPEFSPDAQYKSDLLAHLLHLVVPAPLVLTDTFSAGIYGRHRELPRGWWATPGDKQLRLFSLAP